MTMRSATVNLVDKSSGKKEIKFNRLINAYEHALLQKSLTEKTNKENRQKIRKMEKTF